VGYLRFQRGGWARRRECAMILRGDEWKRIFKNWRMNLGRKRIRI
jgi:hypothetical protein